MPSSYTTSARFTLQATGENNNTWGVILNSGVFQLVDDNVNGRLGFALSGTKVLTTALGATDEARMAFLDVTGGTGGTVTIPAASKGYFIRNAAAGAVSIAAGGPTVAAFQSGDAGPVFSDGASVWPVLIGGKTVRKFVTDADQVIIDYVNAAISAGSISLPPATGQLGKALVVRMAGPVEAWTPSFIQFADVQGLSAATGADLRKGSAYVGSALVPPQALVSAMAISLLSTAAATVPWSIATNGWNTTVNITTAGKTLAAPTDGWGGLSICCLISMQAAVGLAFDSRWDFGSAGVPTPSAGGFKVDRLFAIYFPSTDKWLATYQLG